MVSPWWRVTTTTNNTTARFCMWERHDSPGGRITRCSPQLFSLRQLLHFGSIRRHFALATSHSTHMVVTVPPVPYMRHNHIVVNKHGYFSCIYWSAGGSEKHVCHKQRVYIFLGPAYVFLWLVLFVSEDHKFLFPLLRNHLFPPENLAHIISHRGQTRHAPRNSQIFPFLSSRSIFRTHGASFVSILCIVYHFFHNLGFSHLLFSLFRELKPLGCNSIQLREEW